MRSGPPPVNYVLSRRDRERARGRHRAAMPAPPVHPFTRSPVHPLTRSGARRGRGGSLRARLLGGALGERVEEELEGAVRLRPVEDLRAEEVEVPLADAGLHHGGAALQALLAPRPPA